MDGEAASEDKHISAQSDRAAREARKVHLGWGYSVSASCGVSPLGFFAAADSPHLPFFEFEFLCDVFFRFPIFFSIGITSWNLKNQGCCTFSVHQYIKSTTNSHIIIVYILTTTTTNILINYKSILYHILLILCYIILYYIILYYIILYYVMLCYVMLCYVMLCYVMLCYVMLCYVMLYHIILD